MTNKTVIAYWMDRTEATRPWIVSLEDGTSSKTLRVLPTEEEAREAAEAIAAERGLPLEPETRTCAQCGKQGPIAEDETDPADHELALDSRGLVIATPGVRDNEYVCGACLTEAEDE